MNQGFGGGLGFGGVGSGGFGGPGWGGMGGMFTERMRFWDMNTSVKGYMNGAVDSGRGAAAEVTLPSL